MRTFILALAAIVGLISLPAYADHHSHPHTVVSFGFGYGYPAYPYGFYRPYYGYGYGPGYGPWYGYPSIGVGEGPDGPPPIMVEVTPDHFVRVTEPQGVHPQLAEIA